MRELVPAQLAQPLVVGLRMSSPSKRTSPAVGSISRVRQRTSVDLPRAGQAHDDEDLAGRDVEDTSRTAAVAAGPVHELVAAAGSRSFGRAGDLRSAFGPNTFHRSRTAMTGVEPRVPGRAPRRCGRLGLSSRSRCRPRSGVQPPNQRCGAGSDVLPDVLGLAVLVQAGRAQLPADAGLLEAAPLRLRHVGVVVVDPDRAVRAAARRPAGPCRRPASTPRRPGRSRCRWRARPPRPRR